CRATRQCEGIRLDEVSEWCLRVLVAAGSSLGSGAAQAGQAARQTQRSADLQSRRAAEEPSSALGSASAGAASQESPALGDATSLSRRCARAHPVRRCGARGPTEPPVVAGRPPSLLLHSEVSEAELFHS